MEKTFSTAEIAEKYGVDVTTITEWIRVKRLSALKIGKLYRIRQQDLDKFEAETATDKKAD